MGQAIWGAGALPSSKINEFVPRSGDVNSRIGSPHSQVQAATEVGDDQVYSGEAIWWARALFRSKVGGLVPRTWDVKLRIVGEAK